jgi:hypothetical protein
MAEAGGDGELVVHHAAIDTKTLREFQTTVANWIAEIHRDTDNHGCIVTTPTSLCGKKVIELREHCMARSTEMASIRLYERQTHTTAWHILRRTLYFLGEGFLPIFIALGMATSVYFYLQNGIAPPPQLTSPTPTPAPWYSPTEFATIAGELAGAILGTVKTFGSTALDATTGITNTMSKLQIWAMTLCTVWLVYTATLPCTGLLTRARTSSEKREHLAILQSEFAREYRQRIEQALFIVLLRPVLETMEHFLASSSQTAPRDMQERIMDIAGTYSTNYELLYHSMLRQVEMRIRAMDTATLLRSVPQNAQFTTLLYQLIRESEDEFARNLMVFHQGLTDISGEMKGALVNTIHNAYTATAQTVSRKIPLNIRDWQISQLH